MSGVPKSLGIVKFQGIFPTVRFLYALYTDEVKVTRVMAFQALAIEGSKQYYAYLDQCGKEPFWFFALPLKWENADGAPLRAVAFWAD